MEFNNGNRNKLLYIDIARVNVFVLLYSVHYVTLRDSKKETNKTKSLTPSDLIYKYTRYKLYLYIYEINEYFCKIIHSYSTNLYFFNTILR